MRRSTMLQSESLNRHRKVPMATGLSDSALLQKVARDRDQAAFAEIHQRYIKSAYRLARYITHHSEDALEVVQESMLAVWRSSASFKPGNARGWIMKIVANESLMRLKKKSRRIQEEPALDDLEHFKENDSQEDSERTEMLHALRRCLETLPQAERSIVSMYYVADYTQDEIARKLDIPQRTISYKLKTLVEKLRAEMRTAGFAKLPALSVLGEAIAETGEMDPGVWRTLDSFCNKLPAHPEPKRNALGTPAIMAGGLLCLAALTMLIYASQPPASKASTSATQNRPSKAIQNAAPQPTQEQGAAPVVYSLPFHWDFKKGVPEQFEVHGLWTWDQKQARMTSKESTVVLISGQWPAKPIKIKINAHSINSNPWSWRVGYRDGKKLTKHAGWGQPIILNQKTHQLVAVFSGRYALGMTNNKASYAWRYEASSPRGKLFFRFLNIAISSVEITAFPNDAAQKLPHVVEKILAAAQANKKK